MRDFECRDVFDRFEVGLEGRVALFVLKREDIKREILDDLSHCKFFVFDFSNASFFLFLPQ
jgi:hypothetical protein